MEAYLGNWTRRVSISFGIKNEFLYLQIYFFMKGVIVQARVDWFLHHDLNAILVLPAIAQFLLLNDPTNGEESAQALLADPTSGTPRKQFTKLLKLWLRFQGMNPPEDRQTAQHVLFESSAFATTFSWEIELIVPMQFRLSEGNYT